MLLVNIFSKAQKFKKREREYIKQDEKPEETMDSQLVPAGEPQVMRIGVRNVNFNKAIDNSE